MKEFKVIKSKQFSNGINEYAIVATHVIPAEPDAGKGFYFDRESIYIIASNIEEAQKILNKEVKPYFS